MRKMEEIWQEKWEIAQKEINGLKEEAIKVKQNELETQTAGNHEKQDRPNQKGKPVSKVKN